ncbi:MAG: HAMP domain-containing protein [Calditrichaeota bacterium]|nr:HAMP domain-containing protein [Calditrichota bacterium]
MKRIKFRYKVVITVVVVVLSISFVSFHFFNSYLLKKMQANYFDDMKVLFSIFRENYVYNLREEGGKILFPLLDNIARENNVSNAYLFDNAGNLVYTPLNIKNEYEFKGYKKSDKYDNSDSFKIIPLDKQKHLYRGVVPINNNPSCYSCHDKNKKHLGFVVIDFNLQNLEKNSSIVLNFGRVFAVVLILLILSAMRVLHYRSINKGLKKFDKTIKEIGEGDLTKRVKIEDSEELGRLADRFNQMIDKIYDMQIELNICNQNKLQNARKLASVGEMAASLAHEIKNPLTGITNAIEVIAREISDPEYKLVLQEIRRQGDRVNKAINDLLQFARPVELKLNKENINDLVRQTVFFHKNQISKHKIEFYMNLDFDLPLINIDRKQIENVLTNLLQNAQQAIPDDRVGVIEVRTRYMESEDLIKITIKDNGKGISKENLDRIFKPFFTTRSKGTGLGLAISQRIIEQHQGVITVESIEGEGTKFIIDLPVHPSALKKDLKQGEIALVTN